jgi:hypothetical protein
LITISPQLSEVVSDLSPVLSDLGGILANLGLLALDLGPARTTAIEPTQVGAISLKLRVVAAQLGAIVVQFLPRTLLRTTSLPIEISLAAAPIRIGAIGRAKCH